MFAWATDQFDKLSQTMAPPPTDAAGRFSYAVSRNDENTAMGCIAEIDPIQTVVNQAKGWFPIHMACQYSMVRLIRLLMNQPGVNIQQADYAGCTPLHHACMSTQRGTALEVVKLLINDYSADPCAKNAHGKTPYDFAHLDSIRQYLLPIQLQRETQFALDNGGQGLPPGIDLGGLKINRSNMAPPPQFGGSGVVSAPTAAAAGPSTGTPGYARYPQTPGMAPSFGSPVAVAGAPPAPQQQQPLPASQPIARAPASMPGRSNIASTRRSQSNDESSRYSRTGGSSLAVYSKYKADGFHSSSSDVSLQKKYGHVGTNSGAATPPPSSGNAPASLGPNPFVGAGAIRGVQRYAAYGGQPAASAPASGPVYAGMGYGHPAGQPAASVFSPAATTMTAAPAFAAPSPVAPTTPFMPSPPYSGITSEPQASPSATTSEGVSPFATPQPSAETSASATNLFESPPKAPEPVAAAEPTPATTNDEPDAAATATASDWVQTTDPSTGTTYYVNTVTNETSWENPEELATTTTTETEDGSNTVGDWTASVDPSSGNTYYYNQKTGETSWEKPAATGENETQEDGSSPEWVETTDPSSGDTYYYNTVTGETSWEKPAALESTPDAAAESTGDTDPAAPEPTSDETEPTETEPAAAPGSFSEPVIEEEETESEVAPTEEPETEAAPTEKEEDESNEPAQEEATIVETDAPPLEETTETSDAPVTEEPSTETSDALPDGWTEVADPSSGQVYYCNVITQETSWERPVAADEPAEGAMDEQSTPSAEPIEAATEPDAGTEAVAEDKPDESDALPDGWSEVSDPSSGKVYYYNANTQETSWNRPVSTSEETTDPSMDTLGETSDQQATISTEEPKPENAGGWEEVQDPSSGRSYYFNKETQETSWVKPAAMASVSSSTNDDVAASSNEENDWVETQDPSSGKSYYYNTNTGETSWVKPQVVKPAEEAKTASSDTVGDATIAASAEDAFAPPAIDTAATESAQAIEALPPQASPLVSPLVVSGHVRHQSAEEMFASPPSGNNPLATMPGSVASTAEDLFGAGSATPTTETAEDLFGAGPTTATETVDESPEEEEPAVAEDDSNEMGDGEMTDIPLSPNPAPLAKTLKDDSPSFANTTVTATAAAPAPPANDLFAAIGLPPPPFQSRQ